MCFEIRKFQEVFDMKKKLSCLLIALAMLAGMSSCSGDGDGIKIDENAKYSMTLTMWLPTSEDTTDEAIAQVENAINKITKANYKTAIDIHAVDDDEYDEAIKKRVLEVEEAAERTEAEEKKRKEEEREAKNRGETLAPKETVATTEVQYVTGDDGVLEEVYPAATSDQLDIFCIRGYDEFAFYSDNGYLTPLSESIEASSKILKSYVYPTFLEWGMVPGDTSVFAIPNSHVIGEYTYLLLNKDQCEKLCYDSSEFVTQSEQSADMNYDILQQFIEDVGATSDITPLRNEFWHPNLYFWNSAYDNDQFSLLASVTSDEDTPSTRRVMGNVFNLSQFNKTFLMMKELNEQGYVGKGIESEFGAAVIKCDAADIKQYEEDYYIQVVARPRAETEDVYQSMFGISTYSLDSARAMEILTLINTDPTVRTILQYGVQGVHWDYNTELTDSGEQTIKIISDDYKMNLVDTGNVFITYPGENIPMSYWEAGKQQNVDSMLSPYIGFTNYINDDNQEKTEKLDALSKEYLDRINAMTAEEFKAATSGLKTEVGNNLTYSNGTAGDDLTTITGLYTIFFDNVFQADSVM